MDEVDVAEADDYAVPIYTNSDGYCISLALWSAFSLTSTSEYVGCIMP